jgi:hypothetical protein
VTDADPQRVTLAARSAVSSGDPSSTTMISPLTRLSCKNFAASRMSRSIFPDSL